MEEQGLKILQSLFEYDDRKIRKLAAKLVCSMLYCNEELQVKWCEYLGFSPISGRVMLNRMPASIISSLKENPDNRQAILHAMFSTEPKINEECPLFWSFPPEQKELNDSGSEENLPEGDINEQEVELYN